MRKLSNIAIISVKSSNSIEYWSPSLFKFTLFFDDLYTNVKFLPNLFSSCSEKSEKNKLY